MSSNSERFYTIMKKEQKDSETTCSLRQLDAGNPSELEKYERALFRAFLPVWSNTSDRIFIVDSQARRLRSRIEYAQQEILVIERAGAVLGGIAVNYDREGTLQLELLGFRIDRSQRFCEALVLFNNGDLGVSGRLLTIGRKHLKECMVSRGREIIYGTSNEKNARAYQSIGFTVTDTFNFRNEKKILLAARVTDW